MYKGKLLILFSLLFFLIIGAGLSAQGESPPDLSFRDFASQDQFLEYLAEVQREYGLSVRTLWENARYLGDVNNDGQITIVDALMLAHYYVGLRPAGFDPSAGDVNGNGTIDIVDALMVARYYVGLSAGFPTDGTPPEPPPEPSVEDPDYSTTNIQEAGVDEGDLIKTDGKFVYSLLPDRLVISRAYPPGDAEIINVLPFETERGFSAKEIFLDGDTLVIITESAMIRNISNPYYGDPAHEYSNPPATIAYRNYFTRAAVYDITDRSNLLLQREVALDGNYLTSRKIDSMLYLLTSRLFIRYRDLEDPSIEIPLYSDTAAGGELTPVDYAQVQYLPFPVKPTFLNVGSIDLAAPDEKMKVRSLVTPANHVYCSRGNLYIAFFHGYSTNLFGGLGWFPLVMIPTSSTYVYRLQLNGLSVIPGGVGSVPGAVLNRFSMSEYDGYFRIATTVAYLSQWVSNAYNNVYILDGDMQQVGALEDLAPGEKIYSARFRGDRGYLVTFKKVDPLIVLDLSEPTGPSVLGELKIPGYSDYLHPYDSNHIIGIGIDTVAADTGNFAWFQGVKLALFDVTDVTNPVQLYQEIIGNRGTTSEVLRDPKALLFSLRKNLLVLPISLAEFKTEPAYASQSASIVFRGAYVYDLSLENGFNLRGRITHSDNPVTAVFSYGSSTAIRRSLYIEDTLYTFSNSRLQLNDLESLERTKILGF